MSLHNRWIVARMISGMELTCLEEITKKIGAVTYTPKRIVMHMSRHNLRRCMENSEAVYRGYGFIMMEPGIRLNLPNRIRGFIGIIYAGDHPMTVPNRQIDEIKAREEAGEFKDKALIPRSFKIGDVVFTEDDRFSGIPGRCVTNQKSNKVYVEFGYMPYIVSVPVKSLRLVVR